MQILHHQHEEAVYRHLLPDFFRTFGFTVVKGLQNLSLLRRREILKLCRMQLVGDFLDGLDV